MGSRNKNDAVIPPPPAGFTLVNSESAPPPPPPGFRIVDAASPDPLSRPIRTAADLPSQEEFDASHQAAANTLTQKLLSPQDAAHQDTALSLQQQVQRGTISQAERRRQLREGARPVTFSELGQAGKEIATTGIPFSKLAPEHPTGPIGGTVKGAAQLAEGLTTPVNAALMAGGGPLASVLGKLSPLLPKGLAAVFSTQMAGDFINQVPGAWEAIESGDKARIAEKVVQGIGSGVFAAMGVKHLTGGKGGAAVQEAPDSKPSNWTVTGEDYLRKLAEESPLEGRKAKSAKESAATFSKAKTFTELFDIANAREDFKKEPVKVTGAGREMLGEQTPPERKPSNAKEAADIFKQNERSYAELFAEAEDRLKAKQAGSGKKKGAKPSVPSEGIDAHVERVVDARDRLARHLAGKPFADLANPDRLAVDDLITQGHGFGVYPEETTGTVKSDVTIPPPPAGFKLVEPAESPTPSANVGDSAAKIAKVEPEVTEKTSAKTLANVGDNVAKVKPPAETPQDAPEAREAPTPEKQPEPAKAAAQASKDGIPERLPKTPAATGRERSISIPGEPQNKYQVKYAVRELEDVHASHQAGNFEANPNYEYTNDHDYSQTGGAERVTRQASPDLFDPEQVLIDAPTAEFGPPVIDARGNVLGGNSRTMTIGRVYDRQGAGDYRKTLTENADRYGIDPKELARFQKPVLVRETVAADPQKAITDLNKKSTAELTPEERAVSDGRRLSSKSVEEIAARMGDLGESGTMAEALRGDNGGDVLNLLEKDGMVTPQEKVGLVDAKGHLTPEAKARIGKALVGRLFSKPSEYTNTPPAMRAKLERVAPQALRVESRPEWSLTGHIRDAVALVEDARAHKTNIAETVGQTTIGEQRNYSPEAIRIAEVLEENPRNVEHAFRRYANDEALSREGAQAAFFEPPTRAQAFADAFGETASEPRHATEAPMVDLETRINEIRQKAIAAVKKSSKLGIKASHFTTAAKKLAKEESGGITVPDIKKLRDAYDNSDVKVVVDSSSKVLRSLGARVRAEGGGAGRVLMQMIEKADDYGVADAGRLLVRIADAKPQRLTREQRFQVLDAMEGRLDPKKLAPDARQVFDAYKEGDTELGLQATGLGVEIQTKNGKRPFAMMDDHFPHVLRGAKDLKRGQIRKDVIENIVRLKIQPDKAAATQFVNDWVSFLESGKRKDSILQHMVDSKQATSEADALAKLEKYRSNIDRHGSLEFARELNLPFYDPDPVRVMPFALASGAKRLGQIAVFGQDHRAINQEILNISRAGGNTDFVRDAVDRMIGKGIDKTDDAVVSRFVRSLSTLKMSLSAIPNATQALNAVVASDLPSFMAGVKGAATASGRRLAIESGATIDPVLEEARIATGGGQMMDRYLRGTGFNSVERFNRAVSANAGVTWAERNFKKAAGSGKGAESAKGILRDLGVDVDAALKAGELTERDRLMAAKKFSDLTQFRTRPQDLPSLATDSPWGKAWFQFKGFAYQQARFAADQTYKEFKAGRPERAARNLLIMGVVLPYTSGEIVRALRNKISGREEKFKSGLARYFDNLAQASSAGILLDVVQSAEQGRTTEFIAGPAAGQAKDLAQMMKTLADDDKSVNAKKEAIKKYALTRFGSAGRRLLK